MPNNCLQQLSWLLANQGNCSFVLFSVVFRPMPSKNVHDGPCGCFLSVHKEIPQNKRILVSAYEVKIT